MSDPASQCQRELVRAWPAATPPHSTAHAPAAADSNVVADENTEEVAKKRVPGKGAGAATEVTVVVVVVDIRTATAS